MGYLSGPHERPRMPLTSLRPKLTVLSTGASGAGCSRRVPFASIGSRTRGPAGLDRLALAQSNWNQSQGGNDTHHNGGMNGEPFNGTQSRLGNYTYGNSNVGGQTTNCTSSHLGNYRYTNCN